MAAISARRWRNTAARRTRGSISPPASIRIRIRFHHCLITVWQRLPSRADEAALLGAARRAYAVPDGVDIAAASGTQTLIQWLPRLAAPGAVAVVAPTYNEHAAAWQLAGHEVIAIGARDEIPQAVRYVIIVNPNNPDGRIMGHAALTRIAKLRR